MGTSNRERKLHPDGDVGFIYPVSLFPLLRGRLQAVCLPITGSRNKLGFVSACIVGGALSSGLKERDPGHY